MSAGIGFTIGSKKVTDTLDGKYTNQVETLIGAAKGKVAIHANEAAHLTSASILAGTDATVQAPDMVLDGKHNTADIKQTHEVKTSGLTVSLGGSIASALNGAYALQQKGKDRHDKRLAALEYVEAGKELRKGLTNINEYRAYTPANVVNHADSLMDSGLQKMDFSARLDRLASSGQLTEKQLKTVTGMRDRFAVEGAQEYQTGFNEMADIQGDQSQYKAQKRAKKDGLANIHVGIGSSYSKSVTELHDRDYAGGKIISNNTTSLLAKSNAPDTGTITAIGETIQGKTVDVIADNTINLQAATNTSRKTENNDTKSWSVGANISVNGGGVLGFDANYNKGMQRENTEKVSYAPSRITANTVNMNSGNDTNVIGSTVKGDRVVASVGGNLYVQSLQDKETYVGKQKNTGFSVSTNGTQLGSISGEHSKGDTRSNYAGVTEQAGIFAGKNGYTITTKGTTTLEGAVIDSKAAAEKNTVSTGRLVMKDIENTAEYSSKNTGVSYNHIGNFKSLSQAGQDAVYNSLGLLPKLLPESKESAHSTTKSAIADGTITVHDESVDIRSISRDTANSLNKLDKIFDKKKVEERQELARLFAKDAFEQLHYWEPKTKEEKVAKAIAHGVVAEISARVAGNKPGSGFYAGVTNEALIGEIQKVAKTNPAVAQWLSAGVGAVVNAGLGKPVITGAAEAQYGTKWNLELTEHAKEVRLNGYFDFKKTFDEEYLEQLAEGNPYSEEEIKKAYNDLLFVHNHAEAFGLTPAANDLLGFFLDENPNAHGIIAVDYTEHGYPIYTFGPNSVVNQTFRSSKYRAMNLYILGDAYHNTNASQVSMPTYINSHNFYVYGMDPALALGRASTITTFNKSSGDDSIITIIDNWNHDKMLAELVSYPRIYEAAYILQQSGYRRTFAFKTTYDFYVGSKDIEEMLFYV